MNRPTYLRSASPRWLEEHLDAAWLRVVDVRAGAREAREERRSGPRLREARRASEAHPFLKGHIPGAVSLDVAARLVEPSGAFVSAGELAMAMSGIGVGDEHTVVIVDERMEGAGLTLARILRRYGHVETSLLEGGFSRWVAEGRPVTAEVVRHPFASFTARVAS